MRTPICRPCSALALATALLLTTSCTFSSALDYDYTGSSSYQLASVPAADGPAKIYELNVRPGSGKGYLTVQYGKRVTYQSTGLKLTELDKVRAERLQPETAPYSGLLVRSVDPDSGAAEAGIQSGDLITHINGQPAYYLSHYNRLVANVAGSEELEITLRGRTEPVRLDPSTKERTVREKLRVPLEAPAETSRRAYAGVRLNMIPKEHSRRIYGDDRNAIVICGVVLGSPAYLSGLRSGDVIETVDGVPTPPLDELQAAILERGAKGESMKFEVVRDRGEAFSAAVPLEEYSGVATVRIPVVFNLESGVSKTEWNAAWGILASYQNRYRASETRSVEAAGSYSMALGLIRYSWSGRGSSLRLLWFIRFGSRD